MEKCKKIILLISVMLIVLACMGCAINGKCEKCGGQSDVYEYECAPYIFGSGELEYETKYFCGECARELYSSHAYVDMREKNSEDGFFVFIVLIIGGVGFACVRSYWGNKVNEVVASKGYNEDWFWKGFWRGQLALNDALALPQSTMSNKTESKLLKLAEQYEYSQGKMDAWKCDKCGTINPNYTGTCSCGNSKNRRVNDNAVADKKKESATELKEELNNIELIKKYKELLDSGAITQEEFDKKKNEILN